MVLTDKYEHKQCWVIIVVNSQDNLFIAQNVSWTPCLKQNADELSNAILHPRPSAIFYGIL